MAAVLIAVSAGASQSVGRAAAWGAQRTPGASRGGGGGKLVTFCILRQNVGWRQNSNMMPDVLQVLATDNRSNLIIDAESGVNDAAKCITHAAALYEFNIRLLRRYPGIQRAGPHSPVASHVTRCNQGLIQGHGRLHTSASSDGKN